MDSKLTPEEIALGALAARETMTAAELAALGVGRHVLKRLVDDDRIVRLADGAFGATHVVGAQAQALAATTVLGNTRDRAVVCLFTAARLHGFHDEHMDELWIALSGHSSPRRKQVGALRLVACLWPDYKLTEESGVVFERVYGRDMAITSPARTVVDLWKYRGALNKGRFAEDQVAEMIRRGVETHGIAVEDIRRFASLTGTSIDSLEEACLPSSGPRM